jgi:Flp pilus assembly protein TadB
VSRERARRRAEREAAAAQAKALAQRREQERQAARRRRQARRAALRSLVPRLPGRGYSRRTREQRVGVVMAIVVVFVLAYLLLDSWPVRIGVAVITLLATPVVATALLGRPNR